MEPRAPRHEPLAYVMRAGMAESVHYGSAVVLDADGSIRYAVGDPDAVMYPRSAVKPIQASAMVGCGLDLPADLLALAASSHSGEQCHVDGVLRILATGSLSEDDLRNPIGYPLDTAVRDKWLAAGRPPSRLAQNCSGKHAAMLVTARRNDWSLDDYRDPEHPVQREIASLLAEVSGEKIAKVAVDGCGAPLFALSLTGLARAIGAVASAADGSPMAAVAESIRENPMQLGGSARPVTELIRAVPGLIAKDGAEGVEVAALPDGTAVAIKVADGTSRARDVVCAAALALAGVDTAALAPVLDGADGSDDVTDGLRLASALIKR
ncbi:asparaginase [Haloechinothrix halophila]|uniref:asparaginase n=1 Tax=Haloechinothrix halophila TaxID=1069073 RepID=UPI0003F875DA|nr:asparaginase [Haloechinothrix halophila]